MAYPWVRHQPNIAFPISRSGPTDHISHFDRTNHFMARWQTRADDAATDLLPSSRLPGSVDLGSGQDTGSVNELCTHPRAPSVIQKLLEAPPSRSGLVRAERFVYVLVETSRVMWLKVYNGSMCLRCSHNKDGIVFCGRR